MVHGLVLYYELPRLLSRGIVLTYINMALAKIKLNTINLAKAGNHIKRCPRAEARGYSLIYK